MPPQCFVGTAFNPQIHFLRQTPEHSSAAMQFSLGLAWVAFAISIAAEPQARRRHPAWPDQKVPCTCCCAQLQSSPTPSQQSSSVAAGSSALLPQALHWLLGPQLHPGKDACRWDEYQTASRISSWEFQLRSKQASPCSAAGGWGGLAAGRPCASVGAPVCLASCCCMRQP